MNFLGSCNVQRERIFVYHITIDGKKIGNINELHRFLQENLALDTIYFENLEALWDGLTSHVSMPLTLQWLDFQMSRRALGNYADELMNLFYEIDEELEELFTFILKL
ncbi:barstar family protein [Paenibacillus silvae]|nr:barstar family protein [Paenibacillus silvae]MCK6078197.1 barstar family protein [Paenibacillus silvae]MCK6152539.1 barstar family protein [Paenibacillus silvae]MCK6271066.1 barstar family protein [Paenibacillus silvae]